MAWYFEHGEKPLSDVYAWIFKECMVLFLNHLAILDEQDLGTSQLPNIFESAELYHWNCLTLQEQLAAVCEVTHAFLEPEYPRPNQTALLESAAAAPFINLAMMTINEDYAKHITGDRCGIDRAREKSLIFFHATTSPDEIKNEIFEDAMDALYDMWNFECVDIATDAIPTRFNPRMQRYTLKKVAELQKKEDEDEDGVEFEIDDLGNEIAEIIINEGYSDFIEIPSSPGDETIAYWINLATLISETYFADYDWSILTPIKSEADHNKEYQERLEFLNIAPDYFLTDRHRLSLRKDPCQNLIAEIKGVLDKIAIPTHVEQSLKSNGYGHLLESGWQQ